MSIWLRRLSETMLLAVVGVAAGALPLSGPATLPKYDLATEAKMKVTVEELKLPAKGNEKDAAHLLVKSGADTLDVYLCPKSFLDDMGANFAKGDEITVTGSKIKQDGADLIVAREVVKGTDTLLLRDDKGKPVWNWRH
jgi:hypothetical protein